MTVAEPKIEFTCQTHRTESPDSNMSDMAARYAALAHVHRECEEKLADITARYDDLKRVYQALVEQREHDRQQMLRYASGLASRPRSNNNDLASSSLPTSQTSRIVRLTGSPRILAIYLRIIRTPGLGWFVRGIRRLALKLLDALK